MKSLRPRRRLARLVLAFLPALIFVGCFMLWLLLAAMGCASPRPADPVESPLIFRPAAPITYPVPQP